MQSLKQITIDLLKKLLMKQLELGEQGDAEQIREIADLIARLENE